MTKQNKRKPRLSQPHIAALNKAIMRIEAELPQMTPESALAELRNLVEDDLAEVLTLRDVKSWVRAAGITLKRRPHKKRKAEPAPPAQGAGDDLDVLQARMRDLEQRIGDLSYIRLEELDFRQTVLEDRLSNLISSLTEGPSRHVDAGRPDVINATVDMMKSISYLEGVNKI